MFLTTILLVAVSIVMVYSASAVMADNRYSQPYFFLIKQLMWAILGFALLWIVMRIDYRMYREPVFIWSFLGIVAAALVAVLFGPPINNARRWFSIAAITTPVRRKCFMPSTTPALAQGRRRREPKSAISVSVSRTA